MATQFANGRIVLDGLVLALDASDKNSYPGSGTTWYDYSGNGNNGILTNGPTFSSGNGGSIVFDGIDDKMQSVQTVHSYLSSSTLEFFVTPTTSNKRMTVGGYRHNEGYSSPTIGMVYIDSDNKFYASVITAAEVYRYVSSTTTISSNNTYHVIFTKNTSSGTMQMYINGFLEGTQTFNAATYGQWTSAGSYIGSDVLDFGKSNNTNSGQGWGNDFLNGKIHSFKLYSKILSTSEILQNYNAQKTRFGLK